MTHLTHDCLTVWQSFAGYVAQVRTFEVESACPLRAAWRVCRIALGMTDPGHEEAQP